jgi:hypothetical protein
MHISDKFLYCQCNYLFMDAFDVIGWLPSNFVLGVISEIK